MLWDFYPFLDVYRYTDIFSPDRRHIIICIFILQLLGMVCGLLGFDLPL